MTKINIGCGMTPTTGWQNYDNSLAVRFANVPYLAEIGTRLGALTHQQAEYFRFLRSNSVRWADATKRIPHESSSVDVIYASHMLEHLYPEDARKFLKESYRVLRPGATIRLVVPDLAIRVKHYLEAGSADQFMDGTGLGRKAPATWQERLRLLVAGDRGHKWMYDESSLRLTLLDAGFVDVVSLPPGETRIPNPGDLDLFERSEESVYVEATKPDRDSH